MEGTEEKQPLLHNGNPNDGLQNNETKKIPAGRSAALSRWITVEPVILLVVFCVSSLSPLIEQYGYAKLAEEANVNVSSTEESICHINASDPAYQQQQELQSEVSKLMTNAVLIQYIPSVFTVPICLFLSDCFGRKPVLVVTLAARLVSYMEWLFFVHYKVPLNFLLIGSATGALFSADAWAPTAMVYFADVTDHSRRSFMLVIYEVCLGIASVLSNITTGFLLKFVDAIYAFGTLVIAMTTALLYTIFILPESLDTSVRQKHSRSWKACFAPYKGAFKIFFKDDGTKRRWKIQVAILIANVSQASHVGTVIIAPLYLMNSPLCFGSLAIAIFVVEVYSLRAIGSLLITKIFKNCFGDTSFMILSLISDASMFAMLGFLPSTFWIFIGEINFEFRC